MIAVAVASGDISSAMSASKACLVCPETGFLSRKIPIDPHDFSTAFRRTWGRVGGHTLSSMVYRVVVVVVVVPPAVAEDGDEAEVDDVEEEEDDGIDGGCGNDDGIKLAAGEDGNAFEKPKLPRFPLRPTNAGTTSFTNADEDAGIVVVAKKTKAATARRRFVDAWLMLHRNGKKQQTKAVRTMMMQVMGRGGLIVRVILDAPPATDAEMICAVRCFMSARFARHTDISDVIDDDEMRYGDDDRWQRTKHLRAEVFTICFFGVVSPSKEGR
jgi:hypothetical protein